MALQLHLLTKGEAERVVSRRRDESSDLPWAPGYPLDGDLRACASYASHLPAAAGPAGSAPFGYYQIVEDGLVVGGIGFHSPPSDGVVEVGYGVVPQARGRGIATLALRMLLDQAVRSGEVRRVRGRTEETNLPSRAVMEAAGMRLVGRDSDFLHYEIELEREPTL